MHVTFFFITPFAWNNIPYNHIPNYVQLDCSNLPSMDEETLNDIYTTREISIGKILKEKIKMRTENRYTERERKKEMKRISMMHRSYCFISEPLTCACKGTVRLPSFVHTSAIMPCINYGWPRADCPRAIQ